MIYPFVYIASLPRTGSTLLSEALTQLPYAFILHEPHLGKNYFAVKSNDATRLKACGVDLYAFVKYRLPFAFLLRRLRPFRFPQDYMVREVKQKLLPHLTCDTQIGVKEIAHVGWQNYIKHFPDMKVILTGRDPRDIYLSMYRKSQRDRVSWRGPFNPTTVARFLNKEFEMQLALSKTVDSLSVRYEDFCRDAAVLQQVKDFAQSPIPTLGTIGAYISSHPTRTFEHDIHGGEITIKSVNRWKDETDPCLLAEANACLEQMSAYSQYWGYQ